MGTSEGKQKLDVLEIKRLCQIDIKKGYLNGEPMQYLGSA